MLIAIDHGNKQIKTINCEPFTSGLLESDTQPFGKDVLMYKGKYYQVTDQRIPYRKDKTEDERFFILTLFAIAKEIEEQGFYHPGVMRVQLAVGLPPAYYGTHYQSFIRYFLDRGTVSFSYRGKTYAILIDNVGCYPQSYAAALTMFQTLSTIPKALVLDIGGMTADYLQIKYGEGDLSVCDSLENGVIRLYNRIESKVRAEQDILLTEREIEKLIYPVGFYHDKARHLKELPKVLKEKFGGVLPNTVEELCELPGVGRKTANLTVAVGFGLPAIGVDVHVHRICNRLGLIRTKTPFETEMTLRKILPVRYWKTWNSHLVSFGQTRCAPVRPKCEGCPIAEHCPSCAAAETKKEKRR